MDTGLAKAIAAKKTKSALAQALGLTNGAVSQWGRRIPLKWVIEVERVTGVPREELRPDVFGPARNT